jgi:hypothetical protein
MAQSSLSLDDIRRMATDIGLTGLTDAHLQALLVATQAAQARRKKLDISRLTYADEPAHVFSLDKGDKL